TRRDYSITVTRTSDSAGQSRTTVERFVISGTKVRFQPPTRSSEPFKLSSFTILDGADSTLTAVMPPAKFAVVTHLLRQHVNELSPTTITDVSRRDSVDLGLAEKILGYAT